MKKWQNSKATVSWYISNSQRFTNMAETMKRCKTFLGDSKNLTRSSSGNWQNGARSWEGFPHADKPLKIVHHRRLLQFHPIWIVSWFHHNFYFMWVYISFGFPDVNAHFECKSNKISQILQKTQFSKADCESSDIPIVQGTEQQLCLWAWMVLWQALAHLYRFKAS